jgi:hypothetical protein
MNKMIIEFQTNNVLACNPPKWKIYCKHDNDIIKLNIDYKELKLFIEKYGVESNNISELKKLHIDTKNIVENITLMANLDVSLKHTDYHIHLS